MAVVPRNLAQRSDPGSWVDEVTRASKRLAAHLTETPLVASDFLSRELGRPVLLKLESMQPVAAFKVRAALNSILAHLDECRSNGVVTNSSGNFAQAVAYAATRLGVESTIVMMRGASAFKRGRTEAFGGNVVLCEDSFEARFAATEQIRIETGRRLLHPYNSRETIAGNATLGLELLEQVGSAFDLYVPISGGGLIAGTTLAVKAGRPECCVFGVQAEANPSMKLSLEAGRPVRTAPAASLADALTVLEPGSLTFPIVQEHVESVELVSEEGMASAVRLLAVEQKLVVEPGAAVSVAAALAAPRDRDRPVVCVLSGGNIAPETLRALLAAGS
ncbi:MAG: threonine/serine dehydratase [Acidobacteriia bacterium]|nr:threonine/serine dehydratase [Terriglobia bacterium]